MKPSFGQMLRANDAFDRVFALARDWHTVRSKKTEILYSDAAALDDRVEDIGWDIHESQLRASFLLKSESCALSEEADQRFTLLTFGYISSSWVSVGWESRQAAAERRVDGASVTQ